LPYKLVEKIAWFPNNLLRNVARLPNNIHLAPTYFIGIDVDLIPSLQFNKKISGFIDHLSFRHETVYLIPVFEAKNLSIIENINSKIDLMEAYKNGTVHIFHNWCTVCYNYYDYDKWFSYSGGIVEAYSGTFTNWFTVSVYLVVKRWTRSRVPLKAVV